CTATVVVTMNRMRSHASAYRPVANRGTCQPATRMPSSRLAIRGERFDNSRGKANPRQADSSPKVPCSGFSIIKAKPGSRLGNAARIEVVGSIRGAERKYVYVGGA